MGGFNIDQSALPLVSCMVSGRGAARLARYSGGVEVVGSNPVAPTIGA